MTSESNPYIFVSYRVILRGLAKLSIPRVLCEPAHTTNWETIGAIDKRSQPVGKAVHKEARIKGAETHYRKQGYERGD